MSFFKKIADFATGGLVKEVGGLIKDYFPPDMSDEQKAKLNIELERMALERQKSVDAAIAEAENAVNERIKIYEGTASDLRTIPVLGPIMIFLRGSQRIVWGFACIYIDYMVFSSEWTLADDQLRSAFWVINFLVLGFLFGERAVQNVAPLLTQLLKKK